jgi:hypothetical protein
MGSPDGFAFFETGNPFETGPIFSYYEENGHFTRVYDSFWDMVEKETRVPTNPITLKHDHESALRRVQKLGWR